MSLGGAIAIAVGQVASALLYGVKAYDVFTLAAVVALLSGGGLIAGLIPALRASRIEPAGTLRTD